MNKNNTKKYKILKGSFPMKLEDWGEKNQRSKLESIIHGLHKIFDVARFNVYGPYASYLNDNDLYNVQHIRKNLSATLITFPSVPYLPCEIHIIGSEKAQYAIAKILQLEKVKRRRCDCDSYWCFYK
ncbi:MAG: hypothetical protein AABX61_01705 [Nanoarchaeota archaeon]